jgi:hypothetical protein
MSHMVADQMSAFRRPGTRRARDEALAAHVDDLPATTWSATGYGDCALLRATALRAASTLVPIRASISSASAPSADDGWGDTHSADPPFDAAEATAAAMLAAGVDLSDEMAVDAWLAGVNTLPPDERERLFEGFSDS